MYSRATDAIDRSRDGLEPASFRLTLATDGEASDGHILSVEGAELPAQLPLLIAHENDPRAQIGHLDSFSLHLRQSPKRLRAIGKIEMGGEGAAAEERRDLALKIERGHLRGMSVRWDSLGTPIPRMELPDGHPARVEDDEPDARKRIGLYFSKWRALEGSLVPVGADAEAAIGRAFNLTNKEASMRLLATVAEDARGNGLAEEDILNAVWKAAKLSCDPAGLCELSFDGRTLMLPKSLYERLQNHPADQAVPAPVAAKRAPLVIPLEESLRIAAGLMDQQEQAMLERIRVEWSRLRGRI